MTTLGCGLSVQPLLYIYAYITVHSSYCGHCFKKSTLYHSISNIRCCIILISNKYSYVIAFYFHLLHFHSYFLLYHDCTWLWSCGVRSHHTTQLPQWKLNVPCHITIINIDFNVFYFSFLFFLAVTFFFIMIALGCGAVVCAVIVLRIYHSGGERHMPTWLKFIIIKRLQRMRRRRHSLPEVVTAAEKQPRDTK